MNQPIQSGYTCSEAASKAVSRLETGLIPKTPDYKKRHDFYLKSFYHYGNMDPEPIIKNKILPNRFVESMITYWKNKADGRFKLSESQLDEIIKDPITFAKKTKSVYEVKEAKEILKVSRQTVIHWMTKGWISYIQFGKERKPLKSNVNEMIEFYDSEENEHDCTIYRRYWIHIGVISEGSRGKKAEEPPSYAELAAKCSELQTGMGELEKTVEEIEEKLKKTEEEKEGLTAQPKKIKKQYEPSQKTQNNQADKTKIRTLETQVTKLERQNSELNGKNSKLQKEYGILQKKYDLLQDEYNTLQETNTGNIAIIAAYEIEAKEGKADSEKAPKDKLPNQERDKLINQIQELEQKNADLVSKNLSFKRQVETTKQKEKYRTYDSSKRYNIGERIKHTHLGITGTVSAVTSTSIDVIIDGTGGDGEDATIRKFVQGSKLK